MIYALERKKGFTLAEVLVTLAVIGVVAALTIPALVKSYDKEQWEKKYKVAFSIVKQATASIMADNGGTHAGAWGNDNDDLGFYNAYKPYLKAVKYCEGVPVKASDCFASSYKLLHGTSADNYAQGAYSVILSNGISLAFHATPLPGESEMIGVDLNNVKGPNVVGKDFHRLYVFKNDSSSQGLSALRPDGWDVTPGNITNACPSDLGSSTGHTCGVRILRGDYAEDY